MSARILVIDDDEPSLELMLYLLRARAFETEAARDGREGLIAMLRLRPHLAVCDIGLPTISGYEVARQARREPMLADTRLVAVTAHVRTEDRGQAQAAGFDGYIAKPIDPETFVDYLQQHLPQALRRDTPPANRADGTPASPATGVGPAVLVTDDREVNRDFAGALLRAAGYRVLLAGGMHEALRLAREMPPDLILSDVVMQDGSGFDLLRALRLDAALARIPFVFLTSTASNAADRLRGLALGARRYLFRPIEPADLLREISACLAEGKAS